MRAHIVSNNETRSLVRYLATEHSKRQRRICSARIVQYKTDHAVLTHSSRTIDEKCSTLFNRRFTLSHVWTAVLVLSLRKWSPQVVSASGPPRASAARKLYGLWCTIRPCEQWRFCWPWHYYLSQSECWRAFLGNWLLID
jgi:hypothetical protein